MQNKWVLSFGLNIVKHSHDINAHRSTMSGEFLVEVTFFNVLDFSQRKVMEEKFTIVVYLHQVQIQVTSSN